MVSESITSLPRLGKFLLLAALVLLPLSACGKKPGDVDAPPEGSVFPRTYPPLDAAP